MKWEEIPEAMDAWVLKSAAPAWDVRQAASRVLTATDIGYYYHPELEKVAIYAPKALEGDRARTKAAAVRAVGKTNVRDSFLAISEFSDPNTGWIKVAYSPTVRRLGEYLNFFPGNYPGDVPNHPSPVAAMLTSGLLGAGLGYGTGALLGHLLPEGYGDNLGRTGLVLGGALGATPGALWGLTNKFGLGRRFNDPILLDQKATDEPIDYPQFIDGANAVPPWPEHHSPSEMPHRIEEVAHHVAHGLPGLLGGRNMKHAIDAGLQEVVLGKLYKQACEKVAYAFGQSGWEQSDGAFGQVPVAYQPTPVDVNINALGQSLYNQGASPNLAATTMSAMYAAQQLPDQRASPGWATYGQLGQLAQNAAGDYVKGMLVGGVINNTIGTPFASSTFGAANAGLGIISAVVPKLFGG